MTRYLSAILLGRATRDRRAPQLFQTPRVRESSINGSIPTARSTWSKSELNRKARFPALCRAL
jgi:hypothetical protein